MLTFKSKTPFSVFTSNKNIKQKSEIMFIDIDNIGLIAQPLEQYIEKQIPANSAKQLPITLSNSATCKSLYVFPRIQSMGFGKKYTSPIIMIKTKTSKPII
jgi:hypothetical protein